MPIIIISHSTSGLEIRGFLAKEYMIFFLCPIIRGSISLYHKYPKISNTLFYIALALILLFMQLLAKILSGMANSEDPDQTAPEGAV